MELNGRYTDDGQVSKVDIVRMRVANDKLVTGNGTFPALGGPGGKCVDVAGDDAAGNGGNVQLWGCQSVAQDQLYTARNGGLSTLNRCLDITGANPAIDTAVQL
jgi:hypothetical protein